MPPIARAPSWSPLSYAERRSLLILYGVAVAIRIAFLVWQSTLPHFAWNDPDDYLGQGRRLLDPGGGWIEAVRYHGQYFKAPLYPVFLTTITSASPWNDAWSAAVVETLVGASLVPLTFILARGLHSSRAGWIAAALQTVELQQMQLVSVFRQEEVYIPAVTLALLWLIRAIDSDSSESRFLVAGLALGVAALGRSMPVMFVVPAALAIAGLLGWRRPAWARAGVYVAGFLLVVLPYSLVLSARVHRVIVIENISSYGITRGVPTFERLPPSLLDTARIVWTNLGIPGHAANLAHGVWSLSGGRALQTMRPLPDAAHARVFAAAEHLLEDALFGGVALVAPFGILVAARRRVTSVIVLWVVVNVASVVLAGYSGPRFRTPFLPELMVLAAIPLAGGWRRPGMAALAAAAAGTATLAMIILPSLPRTLGTRADFGIDPWTPDPSGRITRTAGRAGFTLYPSDGAIRFTLSPTAPARDARVDVVVDGTPAQVVMVADRPVEVVHTMTTSRRWAFVELRADTPLGIAAQ